MQRKKPLGSGLEDRVGDGPDVDCEGPGAGRTTTAALEKWLDFLLVFIYLFIWRLGLSIEPRKASNIQFQPPECWARGMQHPIHFLRPSMECLICFRYIVARPQSH